MLVKLLQFGTILLITNACLKYGFSTMFSIPSNSFGNELSSIAETITNGHFISGSSIVDMIMYDQS
jgi:hypothetical protein